jgi:hypothetical protein
MFVCNESIVSKLIGIVYLKVNNCSFFIYIKYVGFLRKFAQKGGGSQMGVANAIPTPTPKPDPDTDTETDELVPWHQTEQ